ncbi:glycoside hydrolase family 13 protein [Salinilacihabitans rarus]|uniref:glycoside hydrolase family 13 protein n=1 Tax=Salinilacihabitans rarus TaxID=2961596 RepID=UPI0020C93728|nr:alpha-glucosidase [Salinilacihabitans rarus]
MTERAWWKEAVVYQVYPRSFNDSDGDGVGDLPGIVEKVDYLDDLGIDVVWLNPVYESPMADNGYDIADYRSIHPAFGTMDDWETLLAELHDRDMRLIMDLVVNHTSEEHDWFVHSRQGDEAYADYYYWRDGRNGGEEPPNNWESFFGGPAWRYDEERGQYVLHLYDESQPDLNWRTEAVREDVYEMMTWWLEKGIDGFRMDVINLVSKPEGLPDGDPDVWPVGADRFVNGPRLGEYLAEMNEAVLSAYDAVTVGETVGMAAETATEYVGDDRALNMAIHFEHVSVDRGDGKYDPVDLDLVELKAILSRWQTELAGEAWNCLYWSNHDQPRAVSRFGDDGRHREESAKMLATVLFTLQGTPFVYQGQEIGMTNATFEDPDEIRDVWAENFVAEALASDASDAYEEVRPIVEECSRDNARTPMQWSADEHAGFTDGEPWIGVNDGYDEINVEAARADPDSVWHYYRDLIELRGDRDVFVYGEYEHLLPDHPEVFAYRRTLDDEQLVVACNFFDGEPTVEVPGLADAALLIGNYPDDGTDGDDGAVTLRPYEARVYERTR